MILNQRSPIQSRRLTRSGPSEEVEVAAVDPGVEVVSQEAVSPEVVKTSQVLQVGPRALNIQIYPQESGWGAICTENSDEVHISVLSQGHVPGKMCLQPSLQTNEPVTNLATLTFIHL